MLERLVQLECAYDANHKFVHIDNVPNGLDCNCTCPYCNMPLIAKNEGKKNAHHFAHQGTPENERKCIERTLHLMAEKVLLDLKRIYVPTAEDTNVGFMLIFTDLREEVRDNRTGLIPDLRGTAQDGKEYWIEIMHTHKVDDHKKELICKNRINTIEVDVRGCGFSEEYLKSRYLENLDKKKWIYYDEIDRIKDAAEIERQERYKAETERAYFANKEAEQKRKEEERAENERGKSIELEKQKRIQENYLKFVNVNIDKRIVPSSFCLSCPYSTKLDDWEDFKKKYTGRVSEKMQKLLEYSYNDVKVLGLHWEFFSVRYLTDKNNVDYCEIYPYIFCKNETDRLTNYMARDLMELLNNHNTTCKYISDSFRKGQTIYNACNNIKVKEQG